MYPNLYYAFRDLFGVEWRGLRVINSFGFFVALSFLAAAWLLVKELQRKQAEGKLKSAERTIILGEPASITELLLNFVLGFILGYKIIGVFFSREALNDPQSYIFSSSGNLLVGIITGAFFTFWKWWEKNKVKLATPEKRVVRIWPSDRVGDIVIIAAIAGFLGAKIFDNLENWDRFIKDPLGNLLSPSGLTFYGGLIVAGAAIIIYLRNNKIPFFHFGDAIAPSMMLAYGLGRIGCQVAGDGDWGITNLKSKPASWIPDWAWSYKYPHNVNKEGISIPDCSWDNYCNQLPQGVYPTPLYEIIASLILFVILWSLRKKIKSPGRLFGLYLIFNGMERFFIEKIRVNTTYSIFGFHPTQAEIISAVLFLSGCIVFYLAGKKNLVKE
ncbi:MAG: prolipoprotein diacylglyceryl transferase [Chitinophagaceae bacterium]|nr:prolipoprotein diacylglyceryl transferase [Chitinophagaceae bacterium]